jgi:amidase
MKKIHSLSGSDLARKIRSRDISSVEAVEHFIARIENLDPELNAVIVRDFDRAREAARKADQAIADNALADGKPLGPLHGVPMTIKDAFEIEGLSCEVGAPNFKGRVSTSNARIVQKLLDAGVIFIGKTNTPFMCGDWQTFNPVTGTTNNPWNLAHTPGGSSGGSAAALAAGLTPLEFGSDIGGSIRVPAHFCGLFGHKPSHGIISQRGHVPPEHGALSDRDLNVVGPLARSVEDLELLLDITMGADEPAAAAYHIALQGPRAQTPKNLRVAVWADDPYCPVSTDISANILKAARTLEALGASIQEAKPNIDLANNTETFLLLLHSVMASDFPPSVRERMKSIADAAPKDDKSLAIMQARGSSLSHADWLAANEARYAIQAEWMKFFQGVDVLLCPVTPRAALLHTQDPDFNARRMMVDGVDRAYGENIVWMGLATPCGLPSTVVPIGLSQDGLPIGMQIIAAKYEDKTSMAVARWLEENGYSFQAPETYN